jgi:predicted small metal-binding protein
MMANALLRDRSREFVAGLVPASRRGVAMKTLACGEIMEGCAATFQGETEEEVLAQAGRHAAEEHGLEVTPEVVELVRSHIRETGEASD